MWFFSVLLDVFDSYPVITIGVLAVLFLFFEKMWFVLRGSPGKKFF